MVNPDVKLLVREALSPVEDGLLKYHAMTKQVLDQRDKVRKERDELREERDELREREGKAAAAFADTLEAVKTDRDKWEKRAVEWRQHAIDFKEEFGRTVDQATAVLQREAARKGRKYTGAKRGRPRKEACSSSDCSSAWSTSEPKRQRKGTPQTQRRVAWQTALSIAAEEAASAKKKLVSLYEQGVPEW